MSTTTKNSSIRSPRRAESIRIAEALVRLANLSGRCNIICTSLAELSPTFEIDGVRFDEPKAALRQVGKVVSLYPDDHEAACKVDHIVDITDDFLKDYFSTVAEKDSSMKLAKVRALNCVFMALVEEIATGATHEHAGSFCVGTTLTIADLQVFTVLAIMDPLASATFGTMASVTLCGESLSTSRFKRARNST